MLSHCSLGAGQRLGIRDGRERPAEAWGEEPVLTWNWSFLPGWLLAMLSYYSRHPASRHDFSIAGQKPESVLQSPSPGLPACQGLLEPWS